MVNERIAPSKEDITRIAQLEPLERTLNEANILIDYVLQHLGKHASSILEIRADVEILKGIAMGGPERGKSKLVGFDTPKLKVN